MKKNPRYKHVGNTEELDYGPQVVHVAVLDVDSLSPD
jgi:hypothetical protein